MNLNEINKPNNRTAQILTESSYQTLTETQKIYLNRWERELWPLLEEYVKLAEAELTADQINAIFQGAEQRAMAGGDNKTIAGKVGAGVAAAAKLPVDIAKKVDAKINELGRMAQNAGPIKNADAKFEDLKKQITANNKDSKIVQGIQKVSDWAKENPGKASLAVGILTAIAAFAGGPVGGAAAGLILRSTKELLQGEKLSSAVGKSIKTAAYGAIAGWALDGIGDWLEGLRYDAIPYDKAPGLTTLEVGFTKTFEVPGFSSVKELGSMVIPEDQVGEFTRLLDVMRDATAGGTSNSPEGINAFNELWTFAKTFDKAEFIADMNLSNEISKAVAVANDQFLSNLEMANSAIAAAAQGSVQASGKQTPIKVGGEEVEPEQGELDLQGGGAKAEESIDYETSYKYLLEQYIAEADPAQGELPLDNPNSLGAKMKRGLGKAASAVGGAVKGAAGKAAAGVKQVGKDLGNKVTANKLNKSWKKMGEPTDAGSIANILADAGLSSDDIKSIGQEQKVDLPAPAASAGKTADSETGGTGGDAKGGAGVTGGDAKGGAGVTGGDAKGDAGTNTTQADGGSNADTASTSGGQGASGSAGASAGNAGASAGERRASDEEIAKWVKGDAKLVDPKNPAVDGAIEANRDGKNIGLVRQANGQDHIWLGQSWVNMATGKSASADTKGLGRPDLEELAKEITKANVAKLVKDQLTAPGVKAGTKQAQVTKTMTSKAAAGATPAAPARTTRPGERFR